jgi:integrative and conjugative element protein (TIGR02256 family)
VVVSPRPAHRPHAVSDVAVLFTRSAQETLLSRAFWQTGIDGLETGGWLIGANTDRGVVVRRATSPGPTAQRRRDSFVDDLYAMSRFELERLWGDPLSSRVGSWHTHPTGTARPSNGDLESWRAGLNVINHDDWQPCYVGVIVARDKDRRWRPHAWVARYDDAGETVVERARIRPLDGTWR